MSGALRGQELLPPPELLDPERVTHPLRLGPFDLHPRISLMMLYDDNINIRSRTQDAQDDFIWVISPGLAGRTDAGPRGQRLNFDYSPSWVLFTEHDEFNSLGHDARVSGTWPFTKLSLGASQSYQRSSGAVADVGRRIQRTTYATALTSNYEWSPKTSFSVNLRRTASEADDSALISSVSWVNDNSVRYQVTPKVSAGVAVSFGFREVEDGRNQTSQSVQLHGTYAPSEKLRFSASAGGEVRQYQTHTSFGPVFSVGATYYPRDGTTLTLNAGMRDQPSEALRGQNYVSTFVGAGLRQRLHDRIVFSVNGNYQNAAYRSVAPGVATAREDNFYSVRTGIDTWITGRWTAGVFHLFRRNESTGGGFNFSNNQVGVQTTYVF